MRKALMLILVLMFLVPLALPQSASAQASDPFIGQIMTVAFTFCPRNWAECDGQLLQIAQYQALFSLLGTTYGGDGRTTFGLPDLRGRFAMHEGNGPGLSSRPQGQKSGVETVTLAVSQLPAHTHAAKGDSVTANATSPTGSVWGTKSRTNIYSSANPDVDMAPEAIGNTGGGQSHDNMPPYLVLKTCIALSGTFPPR